MEQILILYETKYARRQFYLNGKKYTTPGTGPRWDLKAKSLYMPSWKKAYLKGAGIQ
ncbi:minor capsid protein [Enterococcus lactis]|nr:minor capsid protein [Enterococcus lactis]